MSKSHRLSHRKRKSYFLKLLRENPSGIVKCIYCDIDLELKREEVLNSIKPNRFTIEHLVPRSIGGTGDQDNLRPCCYECNSIRGLIGNDYTPILKKIEMIEDYLKVKGKLNSDFYKYLFIHKIHDIERYLLRHN